MKKWTLLALSALSMACFVGCNDSDDPHTNPADYDDLDKIALDFSSHSLALAQASSCDDYRKHLLDALARNIANERFNSYYYFYPPMYDADNSESTSKPGNDSAGGSSAGEFTVTNTQEEGVDELDTVKNDGNYMYAIQNQEIHITKIWPAAEMKEIAVIPRANINSKDSWYYPQGIFLSGKNLIEVSYASTYQNEDNGFYNYRSLVQIRVFDISDPSAPKLANTQKMSGELVTARLVNGRMVIVSDATPLNDWYSTYQLAREDIYGVPRFDEIENESWEDLEKRQEEWRKHKDENIAKYLPVIRAWLEKKYPTLDDIDWPKYSDGKTERNLLECNDLYLPATSSRKTGFLIVTEFTGEHFEKAQAKAVADSGWTVYASSKNIYAVANTNNWWWSCAINEQCESYSHIHHFQLGNDQSSLKYVNSGEVTGIIQNSFWMSEHKDHLRVVTSPTYWGNASNGYTLSVLDIDSPKLMKVTGSVDGFGKDEQLYAARMFGDKGYVVTFRQTDPLFTFDLSDPTKPKLAGELKINGYSSYIHPVGENHLLTIGQDADDNGRITGMQLQLFDVSDLANPKQKYKTIIHENSWNDTSSSSAWSSALYNHHAFNYHAGSGLLAIPVNISSWTHDPWSYSDFSGMFIYRVTPDTDFEFVGGVNHYDLKPSSQYDDYYWWVDVDRARFYFQDAGVYTDNAYVYTISNYGIKVSNALKPDQTIATVPYK